MCHDNEQDSLNTSPLIENISGLNLTKIHLELRYMDARIQMHFQNEFDFIFKE